MIYLIVLILSGCIKMNPDKNKTAYFLPYKIEKPEGLVYFTFCDINFKFFGNKIPFYKNNKIVFQVPLNSDINDLVYSIFVKNLANQKIIASETFNLNKIILSVNYIYYDEVKGKFFARFIINGFVGFQAFEFEHADSATEEKFIKFIDSCCLQIVEFVSSKMKKNSFNINQA